MKGESDKKKEEKLRVKEDIRKQAETLPEVERDAYYREKYNDWKCQKEMDEDDRLLDELQTDFVASQNGFHRANDMISAYEKKRMVI